MECGDAAAFLQKSKNIDCIFCYDHGIEDYDGLAAAIRGVEAKKVMLSSRRTVQWWLQMIPELTHESTFKATRACKGGDYSVRVFRKAQPG